MKAKLDIHFLGRNIYGYSEFSCTIDGHCRFFKTDSRGRQAKQDAREYFASLV